jgi:Zn-dependent M28 family amino/carboxypeptidase
MPGCGGSEEEPPDRFDSERAFGLVELQVDAGPRPAGSETLQVLGRKLRRELPQGTVEPIVGGGLRNLVGVLPGEAPAIVVGAHYDTEAVIPDHVGANDGAAGTAAVIEIGRALERELPEGHREVRLVLFDGEEEPPGCPDTLFEECALRGSKAYVARHGDEVGQMILLDYVANEGLVIPREQNSDPGLWAQLREAAGEVGAADRFPDTDAAGGIIDDHIPFVEAGIPAIDLIDFTYPFRDSAADTPDKLDPDALDDVGETVTELVLRLSESQP